ncbi:MAG: hypothetical protein K5637_02230 [Lachnospiraceae bacterium]|nr:hypothetical protein [Lachnospiraceae bacterium]
MDAQNKSFKWHNTAFCLIMLVIIGHIADHYSGSYGWAKYLFVLTYAVDYPLLFFITGLGSKDIVSSERLDFGKIFPWFAASAVLDLFRFIVQAAGGSDVSFKLFDQRNVSWLFLAFFVIMLAAWAVHRINPWYVMAISVILALAAGYDTTVGAGYALSRILVYFPVFYLGYLTDADYLEELMEKKTAKIVSFIILVFYAVCSYFNLSWMYKYRSLFTSNKSYGMFEGKDFLWGMQYRAMYLCILLIVGAALICIVPGKKIRFLSDIGSRWKTVYFWHLPFLTLLMTKTPLGNVFFSHGGARAVICSVLVAIVFCLIFSLKPFKAVTDLLFGLPLKTQGEQGGTDED